jgi:hypothetical protein
MTSKFVTILKYVGFFSIVFFSIISCEKEIEGVGVDLIENGKFVTGDFVTEVIGETKNVESVISNKIQQYLLGVYDDNEFGELRGSIVSQITTPTIGVAYTYGDNAAIDSVLINIPYQVTKEADASDGKPQFSIDSLFGNPNVAFKLSVYELETFFNTLDPTDPSKAMVYYSDKNWSKSTIPFYSDNFKFNPNDTVAYIKRYMPDGITVYQTDTIKDIGSTPSIKLPLNEAMIQEIFVNNASGPGFASYDAFINYFKGFYLQAEVATTAKSALVSLSMLGAKMTIYYSNNVNETDAQDLNGNGIKGEQNVRVAQSYNFAFNANKSSVYERDYSNAMQSGSERLYVQGAAGSLATIQLFPNNDLDDLDREQYLMTGANLFLYVDQNASSDIVPEQLFIYNYIKNTQIIDMITEGLSVVGGSLERDDDGKPEKYVFKITNLVSEILKSSNPEDLETLAIQVYNPTDIPQSTLDLSIKNYNWIPQGVVLYNQDESAGDKKAKLEIYFTKLNN